MKKLICLLLVLGFGSFVVAQRTRQVSPLQAMVETEIAFAKMSEEQGTRPAFMAFIANDGILFRPRAVKGKQWMAEHPLPASDKRPLLKWWPIFADMSHAGDMGYTFGPWEFKNDIKDPQPSAWGHFVTVWKKQADGSWKFAVDLGISHPPPTDHGAVWSVPKNSNQPPKGRRVNVASEREALLARERALLNATSTPGQMNFFLAAVAENVRVFREGSLPSPGRFVMAESLMPGGGTSWTWKPQFADVSSSGDLGYSYGTYEFTKSGETKPLESGNYLRIWKKQRGEWIVVVDLANPVPPQ